MHDSTSGAAVSPVGRSFPCRREVYDVLVAAGGSLPYERLRNTVSPRLRKYMLKEIENAGGIDAYLLPRLERFTQVDGHQHKMLLISDDDDKTISLFPKFSLKIMFPNGKIKIYVPGMNDSLERMDRISATISEERRRKDEGARDGWDCLVPLGNVGAIKKSIDAVGWLPGNRIIRDRSDYIIDGRARAELHLTIPGKPVLERWPVIKERGLPLAHGLVYSYHVNAHRLTSDQKREYKERVHKRLGVKWADLEKMYRDTLDWANTSGGSSITEFVKIPVNGNMLTFSADGKWVKLIEIVRISGLPHYTTENIKPSFTNVGLEIRSARASGQASAIWIRVEDIRAYLDRATPLWTDTPSKWAAFTKTLSEIAEAYESGAIAPGTTA